MRDRAAIWALTSILIAGVTSVFMLSRDWGREDIGSPVHAHTHGGLTRLDKPVVPLAAYEGAVPEPLGTLRGQTSWARGINAHGHVTGDSSRRNGLGVFVFRDGHLDELAAPDGRAGLGRAINDVGQVVGSLSTAAGRRHAFLSISGVPRDLGTLGGSDSEARALNRVGHVVGVSSLPAGLAERAFLYDGSSLRDLGTLGGSNSGACDINDRGDVVGWAETGEPAAHAFLYRHRAMVDLGTLGGGKSVANGINDLGQVVGWAETVLGSQHAFLYAGDTLRDLGTLGGRRSGASAINAAGQIVGQSQTSSGAQHAFLYVGGRMNDLNDLIRADSGWTLLEAADINDAGQIVGSGIYCGKRRAFLLTPRRAVEPLGRSRLPHAGARQPRRGSAQAVAI